ncbi:MAG: phytoene desaturase, partial [Crocinitomicaceae bacterium]|nr:phytoene desaturase [Crocinitomicaceae bacterium]
VKGIETDQGFISADVVFCNSDVRPTYKHLLPQLPFPSTIFQQESSSSALIFYWGIKKRFPKLDLHNIFFSDHYKEEFDAIFDQQTILHDPTVYVHISSKMKPDDAPENCENWFVMINVPANSGQDWDELKTFARERIIAKLNRILQTDLESLIDFEEMLDPILIEQRTSSYAGALYGSSSNDRMAAFFRHPNFSKIRGLYFVGGSVHPGGGIPLCLLSAKIAVNDLVQNG